MPLTREEIFALGKRPAKVETVTVPDVGDFCLRVMTGTEKDSYSQATISIDGDKARPNFAAMSAALLVRTLSTAEGERLFTDADTAAIGKLPSPIVEPLVKAAKRLNGMDKEAVERTEKNSGPTASDPSGTGSPPTSA